MAARHLRQRSAIYTAAFDGDIYVPVVLDWNAECSCEPPGKNDGVHVPGRYDCSVAESGIGLESLLHRAEHRSAATAVVSGS